MTQLTTLIQQCDKKPKLPKGVQMNKKRYAARIRIGGVSYHLGTFDTAELAEIAYTVAHATSVLPNSATGYHRKSRARREAPLVSARDSKRFNPHNPENILWTTKWITQQN